MFNTVILLVLARLVRVEPTKSKHEPTSTLMRAQHLKSRLFHIPNWIYWIFVLCLGLKDSH